MITLKAYKQTFESALKKSISISTPKNLYSPINYLLSLGGKRLRPILTLMSADIFGNNNDKAIDLSLIHI